MPLGGTASTGGSAVAIVSGNEPTFFLLGDVRLGRHSTWRQSRYKYSYGGWGASVPSSAKYDGVSSGSTARARGDGAVFIRMGKEPRGLVVRCHGESKLGMCRGGVGGVDGTRCGASNVGI